jgi:arylsulfatase A-like enzyme
MKVLFALLLLSFIIAWSHPLEIVRQGAIVGSNGPAECFVTEQSCDNYVTVACELTDTAEPHAGRRSLNWEDYGAQHHSCSFNVLGSMAGMHLGRTVPPLRVDFEARSGPYNILLIIADDLSFDHYAFAGHSLLQTPSIDALATQSVRFPAAYVSSTCRPTLATLLTGLPEHRHGVTYISGPPLGNHPTVADRLLKAGYSTYQAGKFWEGAPGSRGFTDLAPFNSNTGNLSIGRTSIEPLFDFMEKTRSPWFVWFSPFMPHAPHDPPGEYRALYEGLGLNTATVDYFAMISWFDAIVGDLLQRVGDDTVVIFMADNGYVQSGFPGVNESRSKGSSYENGIRTQLLIRHPTSAPVERIELANAVDVTTTILSIAGAYRDDLPGRDLFAASTAEAKAFGSRSTLGLSTERGVLIERWVRVGDWKLIDVDKGDDRLYHLGFDPEETQNLVDAPEQSQLQLDLRNELELWWLE